MKIDELIEKLTELKEQAEDYTNRIDMYFCLNGKFVEIDIDGIFLDEECDVMVCMSNKENK